MADRFIGIQVGAISFLDEGIDRVLDIFQEKAGVNALMLACFTFTRGTGGRQIPGQPLPDHGVQEYDLHFVGGNFATMHPQFYAGTMITDFAAPEADTQGVDILEAVIPKAKERAIETFAWIIVDGPIARFVPNFVKVCEVDVYGRRAGGGCFRHPDFRNWLVSLIEDYLKNYDIAGIQFGSERQGPLCNLIAGGGASSVCCFCEHCRREAQERGINIERARRGYQELLDFLRRVRNGDKPADGVFVTFWRLLLDYPEILAWDKLWSDGQFGIYKELYGVVKAIDPKKRIGWHLWHQMSFSPFFRAHQRYEELRHCSDFIKPVLYNNCAGPRFHSYLHTLHRTILADADPHETVQLMYRVLGYDEAPLDELPRVGFSADYVYRETRRAIAGVGGAVPIYPGIDIDIPTGADQTKCTPEGVRDAVKAAFDAGAQGVILSRKYSEMRLDNLAGVGMALKELGVG